MPRHLFISFLGTNDYTPCTYIAPDGFETGPTRFIQEATIAWRCRSWTATDRLAIFLTQDARKKNWKDDGHLVSKEQVKSCKGLASCLKDMDLPVPVEDISIPDGKSEPEIWSIFQQVYSVMQPEDQVVIDITHGFRSIPMLAIVLLNYARALKRISVEGIHYGAFEAPVHSPAAGKATSTIRMAPIFDLTSFDALMNWSIGVDRFLSAGDATLISRLASESIRPILAESKGKDAAAAAIQQVSKAVYSFSRTLSTCRGRDISTRAAWLKSQISLCLQTDVIKPFQPILQALSRKIEPFTEDVLSDGIHAAEWCLKHNMIQQGYTILLEVLITWIAGLYTGEKPRLTEIDVREIVSSAIHIAKHNTPETQWEKSASRHPEITRRYVEISSQYPILLDMYAPLVDFRNDLNHSGYSSSPKPVETITSKLESFINSAKSLILTVSS